MSPERRNKTVKTEPEVKLTSEVKKILGGNKVAKELFIEGVQRLRRESTSEDIIKILMPRLASTACIEASRLNVDPSILHRPMTY